MVTGEQLDGAHARTFSLVAGWEIVIAVSAGRNALAIEALKLTHRPLPIQKDYFGITKPSGLHEFHRILTDQRYGPGERH